MKNKTYTYKHNSLVTEKDEDRKSSMFPVDSEDDIVYFPNKKAYSSGYGYSYSSSGKTEVQWGKKYESPEEIEKRMWKTIELEQFADYTSSIEKEERS